MSFFFVYNTSDGTLYGLLYATPDTEWTNIPVGCAVLGPIDESDPTARDAQQHPENYTVQNGKLVIDLEKQFANTKQAKIDELQVGLTPTLEGVFTSKATGHTYVTTTNGQTNMKGDIKRSS